MLTTASLGDLPVVTTSPANMAAGAILWSVDMAARAALWSASSSLGSRAFSASTSERVFSFFESTLGPKLASLVVLLLMVVPVNCTRLVTRKKENLAEKSSVLLFFIVIGEK